MDSPECHPHEVGNRTPPPDANEAPVEQEEEEEEETAAVPVVAEPQRDDSAVASAPEDVREKKRRAAWEMFERGDTAAKGGDYEKAISEFTSVVNLQEDISPDLWNKARCRLLFALYQAGRGEEAEKVGLGSRVMKEDFETVDVDGLNFTLSKIALNDVGQKNGEIRTKAANEVEDSSELKKGLTLHLTKEGGDPSAAVEDNGALSSPQQPENDCTTIVQTLDSQSPQDETEDSKQLTESAAATAAKAKDKKDGRKDKRSKEKRDRKEKRNRNRGSSTEQDNWNCSYCNVTLHTNNDFQAHCRSDQHLQTIMSDDGRVWKFRAPPRGVGAESYTMCQQFATEGFCRFGIQCVESHSKEELREWKERFEYRQKKAQKAAKLYGKSMVDTVLEKLTAAKNPDAVVRSNIEGIQCSCSSPLETKITSKHSEFSWTFEIKTSNQILQNVALLNDANRRHFSLEHVKHAANFKDGQYNDTIVKTFGLKSSSVAGDNLQEWTHTQLGKFLNCINMVYKVKISFKTDIFGTFRQSVIFNFGFEPFLRQDLCVDVAPVDREDQEDEKAKEFQEKIIQQPEKWDVCNSDIVDFESPLSQPHAEDEPLLLAYPHPQPQKFQLSANVLSSQLTKQNYRGRMHELLYIEEMAQFGQLTQFNVVTKLQLVKTYLLTPTSTNSSTAKYARPGELFGKMNLGSTLSEDTPAGRLILTNCSLLLLSKSEEQKRDKKKKELPKPRLNSNQRRTAYVAGIEDTGKNTLYLRLSSRLVTDLGLVATDGGAILQEQVDLEVQFQLNRVPLCEMHYAVDKLPDLSIVYPDVKSKLQIPWNPGKQWSDELASQLNTKQREAILAITTPLHLPMPPILIIGPYGTGKTFTLGQAIKLLLRQEKQPRILVCTHSNSAADLYIREYLHPYIEENPKVKLVRVYYRNRWVQTVHQTVQKYCLITSTDTVRYFRNPTMEDLGDCDVVVATLATSRYLSNIGLPRGHFTHVLLDEAAQAMECEALMPLALCAPTTRVVLAGDHMQLSPEVFSQFATEKKFNKSLLERLYDLYPANFPCKILLCENYRSHEAIISYTSQLFYEQKLVASGRQSQHDAWYPLTVFTARGEDVQDTNSTSFYNNSEVYEVVDRVAELQRTWPRAWGSRDDTSIGVVTPYYDQVQRIRSELRKRKLYGVSVERVLNVQGKQFRAIFLSTVRTRKTCISAAQEDSAECDFGFLSNAKLLNTAITRAQSLVAVVGDPIALCSVGKCRKLWERFLEISNQHQSFFGLTWQALRAMLDGVELKKTYVLNPYAPEFVPRARRFRDAFLWQQPTQQTAALMAANAAMAAAAAASTIGPVHGFGLSPFPPFMGPMPPPLTNHQQLSFYPGPPPPPPPRPVPLRAFPPNPPTAAWMNPYTTIPPYPAPMPPAQWIKYMTPNWPPTVVATTGSLQVAPPPTLTMPPSIMPPRPMWGMFANKVPVVPPPPQPPLCPTQQLHKQPLRHASSTPSLVPRPMSPSRRAAPMPPLHIQVQQQQQQQQQQQLQLHHQRQPNPQFANSKYQRMTTGSPTLGLNSSLPQLMSLQFPPPIVGGASEQQNIPTSEPSSFMFLPDGIHVPRSYALQSSPGGQASATTGAATSMDSSLHLMPDEMELNSLLRSSQMQRAWFDHLTVTRGKRDADTFKEIVNTLQQHPDLVGIMDAKLKKKKLPQVAETRATEQPSAILATDLEAILLHDSPRRRPPPPLSTPAAADNDILMPSASLAGAFFSKANAAAAAKNEENKKFPTDGLTDPIFSEFIEGNRWDSLLEPTTATVSSQDAEDGFNIPLYLRRSGGVDSGASSPLTARSVGSSQSELRLGAASLEDNLLFPPTTFAIKEVTGAAATAISPPLPLLPTSNAAGSSSTSHIPLSGGEGERQPLTYANVLRAKQQKQTEMSAADPLTRIRNLGTQGNQESNWFLGQW